VGRRQLWVSDTPAGQAYYDSMLKKYAGWGLDYIKVDCISAHPYRISEIMQIAEAIKKTGRPIVLSLSPGRRLWNMEQRWPNMRRCGAYPTITGTAGRSLTRPGTEIFHPEFFRPSTCWPSGLRMSGRETIPTRTCFPRDR